MPRAAAIAKPTPPALIRVETKGKRLMSPLEAEVNALTTIMDVEQFHAADTLLGDIQRARREWAAEMEVVLKPLREAKQGADQLKAKIDTPLGALEGMVKRALDDWHDRERRRILEANRVADAEARKLAAKIEEASQKELNARTGQMRERLAQRRQELEEQAGAVAITPEVVKGTHSTVRTMRKWRFIEAGTMGEEVTGIPAGFYAFAKAILGVKPGTPTPGNPPIDCLMPNRAYIDRMFKNQPEVVAAWPGIEVYEEVSTVGKRA